MLRNCTLTLTESMISVFFLLKRIIVLPIFCTCFDSDWRWDMANLMAKILQFIFLNFCHLVTTLNYCFCYNVRWKLIFVCLAWCPQNRLNWLKNNCTCIIIAFDNSDKTFMWVYFHANEYHVIMLCDYSSSVCCHRKSFKPSSNSKDNAPRCILLLFLSLCSLYTWHRFWNSLNPTNFWYLAKNSAAAGFAGYWQMISRSVEASICYIFLVTHG